MQEKGINWIQCHVSYMKTLDTPKISRQLAHSIDIFCVSVTYLLHPHCSYLENVGPPWDSCIKLEPLGPRNLLHLRRGGTEKEEA